MSQLFKKKKEGEGRTKRRPILFTPQEDLEVQESALIRNMHVSEFIRRAALGRRADVRIETQLILQLHFMVQEFRDLNKNLVAGGGNPTSEQLLALINEAGRAIKQVVAWR